ncbi:MAG: hypothetical protein ABJK64_18185 [Paraglaciecola sp.]|uniref:tetratricopeptide repeat protein n=1 Tax=Paraglaciecola sp. TaxID=1920173 RepID=UPI0032984E5A
MTYSTQTLCLGILSIVVFYSNLAFAGNHLSVGQMNDLLDNCFLQTQLVEHKESVDKANVASCSTVLLSDWLPRESELNVYFNRGIVFMAKGETQNAIGDFNKVVSLNPDSYRAHVTLAQLLHSEREYLQAKYHYDKAIAMNNTNPLLLHNRELVIQSINAEKQERLSMN